MDTVATGLFLASALALLGSPGPGIAALLAVGRSVGLAGGLRFYGGLQIGLATACAATALGLLSVLQAVPGAMPAMTAVAGGYLLYLAYRIATVPVGGGAGPTIPATGTAGALLGLSNPKAYVAFTALLATGPLTPGDPQADLLLKSGLIVAVIMIVDIAWLAAGAGLGLVRLPARGERALNRVLGGLIVAATVLAFGW